MNTSGQNAAPVSNTSLPDVPLAEIVEQTASFSRAFVRWLEATAGDSLSYDRLRILGELRAEPVMMRVLADRLSVSARYITVLVDSLVEDGLVVRQAHPTDRRAFLVQLTPRGKALGENSIVERIESIGELFADLSPGQHDAFLDALRVLVAGLRARGIAVRAPMSFRE